MPAAKPKGDQRVRFVISCSPDEKDLIKQEYLHSEFANRSKFILDKIFKAIARNDNNYAGTEIKHKKNTTVQVSCTPEELKKIKHYSSSALPDMKRSRWIIDLLLRESAIARKIKI